MKAPRVRHARLQDRIVVFFVVLLMAVQLASFYFIRYAIEQTAQSTLRQELRVGERVFQRLLEQHNQQLAEAASVLTYDFGFREAVASRDRATILSALRNHAARIKATGMAVIGLDGLVVADTLRESSAGKPYAFPDLVARAAELERGSAVRVVDGKPYQVIVVPVLAPLPIAWVSMSFVIDDGAARDLQRLTSADVSFVQAAGRAPRLLASTLVPERREALAQAAPAVIAAGPGGTEVKLGDELYEVLATPLEGSGTSGIHAILQRSVAEGMSAYFLLEAVLLVIAGLALMVTLAGAIRIARRITRPVTELGEAARAIERGNYAVRVVSAGDDEIGELGRAFNRMAKGLAERDNMRDVLGKVAATEVVTQLLEGRIELGGEERDVTVMFADIRNFTGIAEKLTPQQSLQLLNDFLTVVSEVVDAHGGVIDKYLGDGVMALFGAPVTRPDDARRAVACALEIRQRLAALGPSLAAKGLPHPDLGIGINTSRVIAGNIGSPSRLNYTVLGDGVNLAARLEGLTKRYHVPIVIGSLTREAAPEDMVFRELDKVRVSGKTIAERIYEPLGHAGEIDAAQAARLARWHAALELFRARRWEAARAAFESLAAEPGYQRIIQLYMGYVRDLLARPPGDDWDAAFTLYEK